MTTTQEILNKLCKWRTVFAGWQLGTRPDTDGETRAVKDHREVTILLRAEVSALTKILVREGICTSAEFSEVLADEAARLDRAYEEKFPGFSTSQDGLHMDVPKMAETMRRLNFPT